MTKQLHWRDVLPIHPAAELFPMMSEAELRELGADIKKNRLRVPVVLWQADNGKTYLLDGRNRLDALELNGRRNLIYVDDLGYYRSNLPGTKFSKSSDPYALAIALNIHRRHLTAGQKRDLIANVLKARPEQSNNAIAEQVKVDDKTVAKVRSELESTSEIPKLDKTKGKDGKARPAKRKAEMSVRADRAEARCAAEWKRFTAEEERNAVGNIEAEAEYELPSEEEEDEQSFQEALYDHACLFLERMTIGTRRRFFAHVTEKYGDNLDIPEFLRRVSA